MYSRKWICNVVEKGGGMWRECTKRWRGGDDGGFGRNVHLMLGVGMKGGRVIKRLKWLQWRET